MSKMTVQGINTVVSAKSLKERLFLLTTKSPQNGGVNSMSFYMSFCLHNTHQKGAAQASNTHHTGVLKARLIFNNACLQRGQHVTLKQHVHQRALQAHKTL